MPGAAFIQFPWRLLAIITPSVIVFAVYLADQTLPPSGSGVALCAVTVWMIVSCGAFVPLKYPRIEVDGFSLAGVTSSGFREYEPHLAAPLADIKRTIAARWAEGGCSYENLDADREVPIVRFHTVCGRAAVLPLPLYASPFHAVTASTYPRSAPCLALPEFPAICGAAIPARESTVSVRSPTVRSLVGGGWARLSRR